MTSSDDTGGNPYVRIHYARSKHHTKLANKFEIPPILEPTAEFFFPQFVFRVLFTTLSGSMRILYALITETQQTFLLFPLVSGIRKPREDCSVEEGILYLNICFSPSFFVFLETNMTRLFSGEDIIKRGKRSHPNQLLRVRRGPQKHKMGPTCACVQQSHASDNDS